MSRRLRILVHHTFQTHSPWPLPGLLYSYMFNIIRQWRWCKLKILVPRNLCCLVIYALVGVFGWRLCQWPQYMSIIFKSSCIFYILTHGAAVDPWGRAVFIQPREHHPYSAVKEKRGDISQCTQPLDYTSQIGNSIRINDPIFGQLLLKLGHNLRYTTELEYTLVCGSVCGMT